MKLAADGQLPSTFQLQESDKRDSGQRQIAIDSALCHDSGVDCLGRSHGGDRGANRSSSADGEHYVTPEKEKAMAAIEQDLFGNPARDDLLPYQRILPRGP